MLESCETNKKMKKTADGLTWMGTANLQHKSDSDVTISYFHPKKNKYARASIALRNGAVNKITKSMFILFAPKGECLYFKDGKGSDLALKVGNKGTLNGYVRITNAVLVKWAKINRGDYKLLYDNEIDLYYIKGKENTEQ